MMATDGITTVVDHNDYNLTLHEAVEKLMNKENIIAVDYPDYSQEELCNRFPDPEVLNWQDYQGLNYQEMIEQLRVYDQYGEYFQ